MQRLMYWIMGVALSACALAFGAGSAMAQLVNAAGTPLRDNLTTPPTGGGFGEDALLQNTTAPIRLTEGSSPATGVNQSPQFDAFLGLKLDNNPAKPADATGYVTFADFQNATTTLVSGSPTSSPVYSGTYSPNTTPTESPWPITITTGGSVTVNNVALYLSALGIEVTGTITGTYEQPGANCPAGGVKLDTSQPGLDIAGAGVDDGSGGNSFLCVVSANNDVFPTDPTGPGPLTGSITNDP